MKNRMRDSTHCGAIWIWGASVVLCFGGLSCPAFAALGGGAESVHIDQERMSGTVKITREDGYTQHEIKLRTGTIIREYVSPGGVVFCVAWQGPFVPDMRQILGTYFDRYSQVATAQRENHRGRRFLDVRERGLVVQIAGHMRSYFGRAYDPTLFPPGVSADEVW